MSARANAWASFGRASIPYLNGDIFHVRSGAGQGGAITQAKKRGMKIIVDHSIAHPKTVSDNLSKLYAKHRLPYSYSLEDPFWIVLYSSVWPWGGMKDRLVFEQSSQKRDLGNPKWSTENRNLCARTAF